jgi:hypothetical protein
MENEYRKIQEAVGTPEVVDSLEEYEMGLLNKAWAERREKMGLPSKLVKEMPTRDVLERYLMGTHQTPTVIFDTSKGIFVDYGKRD